MSEWTEQDSAAVAELYQAELRDGFRSSSAYGRAYRTYFARTGKIRRHGDQGFDNGCRCKVCRADSSAQRKRRKQAREARA